MKTRLSVDDVLALDESQRRSLRILWTPQLYDVAVALICRDVENDEYEPVVFAVGEISVSQHGTILGNLASEAMTAISFPPDLFGEGEQEGFGTDESDVWSYELSRGQTGGQGAEQGEDQGERHGAVRDEGRRAVQDAVRGTEQGHRGERLPFAGGSFDKEECLPLLDIGQMLAILAHRHYSYRINLTITPERLACTVDGVDHGPAELCDALWEAVRVLL